MESFKYQLSYKIWLVQQLKLITDLISVLTKEVFRIGKIRECTAPPIDFLNDKEFTFNHIQFTNDTTFFINDLSTYQLLDCIISKNITFRYWRPYHSIKCMTVNFEASYLNEYLINVAPNRVSYDPNIKILFL